MSWINATALKTTHFDKKYNRQYLEAIADASVLDSVSFINQTDVTVFHSDSVVTTQCSRDLFASTSEMPGDLQKLWDRAAYSDDDSILLGLYLPEKSHYGQAPSLDQQAAIIVRKNTSRWTLIHEFMHHLFVTQAMQEGYDSDQEQAAYNKAKIAFLNYVKTHHLTTDEEFSETIRLFVEFGTLLDGILVHYPLEEVTIESELKEAVASRTLFFVPESTNGYLINSAESALKSYSSLLESARKFQSLAGIYQTKGKMSLDILEDKLNKRVNEIYSITLKYGSKQSSPQLSLSNRQSRGDNSHIECSHGKISQQIASDIKDLAKVTSQIKKFY